MINSITETVLEICLDKREDVLSGIFGEPYEWSTLKALLRCPVSMIGSACYAARWNVAEGGYSGDLPELSDYWRELGEVIRDTAEYCGFD